MIEEISVNRTPSSLPDDAPATAHGMSFSRAAVLTIVCALVTVGGSYAELNASLSLPARATLSVLTLLGVIAFGYAGFQLILALIATTGERRWSGREVSERRTGDRARKPRGS